MGFVGFIELVNTGELKNPKAPFCWGLGLRVHKVELGWGL